MDFSVDGESEDVKKNWLIVEKESLKKRNWFSEHESEEQKDEDEKENFVAVSDYGDCGNHAAGNRNDRNGGSTGQHRHTGYDGNY